MPTARLRVLQRLAVADEAPWLHQEAARRMAGRLQVLRTVPAQWLDWWGHSGGGAAAVQAVWPEARRQVVEPLPALQARSAAAGRAPWWAWGARRRSGPTVWRPDEVPPGQAAMLWANMVLHLAGDAAAQFQAWHRALAVDGVLMFSTLGPDTLRELRALYAEAGWGPPMQPLVDMHDLGDLLVHGGFADPVMDQETLQLSWSSPEALLAELRGLGANLAPERCAGLRTPRWKAALTQRLAALAGPDGRITMRVELVYGHAFRPAPRPPRGEVAVVSLDALRRGRPPG